MLAVRFETPVRDTMPTAIVVYWPSVFDPLLSVSGFVVGLLVGLTGVGGGALMTPLLILFFGVRPTLAVGTDLAYATITKVVGSLQYIRMGHVNYPYVRWLLVGSIPGNCSCSTKSSAMASMIASNSPAPIAA